MRFSQSGKIHIVQVTRDSPNGLARKPHESSWSEGFEFFLALGPIGSEPELLVRGFLKATLQRFSELLNK